MEFKPIKTLDVNETLKILANYKGPDFIKSEVEKEEKFLSGRNCVKCGSKSLLKTPQMGWKEDDGIMFKGPIFGDVLPKNYLKCKVCNCEFDPYLGIIVGMS